MLYFGNPSTERIREAMRAQIIGCLATPKQGEMPPEGCIWAADNGKFGKGYPGDAAFLRWLEKLAKYPNCRFAVVPDVPFDAAGTLELYPRLVGAVRGIGVPAALAGQNGMEDMELPWDDIDVICLGGDTEWKTGLGGAALAMQARERGKPVHMLRVNSYERLAYAAGIGCATSDGTFLTVAPDENLDRVFAWLDKYRRRGVQGVLL